MTVALSIVGYFVLGLASAGACRYNQVAHDDEWEGMNKDDRAMCVFLAGLLWPIVWFAVMPFLWSMSWSERLARRKLERRKLEEAEAREVERAMRELS